jgi:ABC-type sugar transport system substrate-binding protein
VIGGARRSGGRAPGRSLSEANAERLLNLGRDVDAIAVVTVEHPRITEAIERLRANRVPSSPSSPT